jgi:hypothetical protein
VFRLVLALWLFGVLILALSLLGDRDYFDTAIVAKHPEDRRSRQNVQAVGGEGPCGGFSWSRRRRVAVAAAEEFE